jgi:hypothetical protein
MSSYLVRVELHNAKHYDAAYNRLHAAMEAGGFSRTITGNQGITYHLPPAEYFTSSNLELEQVRDAARRIANSIDPQNAVIAVKGQIGWQGLKAVVRR